ncbi:Rv3235 family protein [Streptomyces sp. NPDC053755]|uniref:Rv3235 family protein n=1 Tax=Streptomyces sp. NPDC053755 TaxID=3155815 RepID=UPI00342719FD
MDSTATTTARAARSTPPATTAPGSSAAGRPAPAGATTRPRTPRPRSAPRGPAGTGPRGSAGTRPAAPQRPRTAPLALPPHTVFAERLLAVLTGDRPVHWMLGRTVGAAYEQLVRLAPATPLRSCGPRPVLRRCSVHQPRPGAVEAFASIAVGDRVRALAFRLERGADGRWRCAAVEVDGLGDGSGNGLGNGPANGYGPGNGPANGYGPGHGLQHGNADGSGSASVSRSGNGPGNSLPARVPAQATRT